MTAPEHPMKKGGHGRLLESKRLRTGDYSE